MKIYTNPHPILRQRAKRVTLEQLNKKDIQIFIENLSKKMVEADGLGLAAPQVGKSQQIIAINIEDGPQIFINPRILWKSIRKEIGEDGCLSIPNVFGLVKRSKNLRLIYWDKNGKLKHLKARGLFARVLQHEIDHLRGILFIDRMISKKK